MSSEYIPLVSWETKLVDVQPVLGESYYYTCKVSSINPNDYSPNTLGIDRFYLVDYTGKIYQITEIIDVSTKTIKIYDLTEDADEGPYISESAFVYQARGTSNALTQAQRKRLHPTAIDQIWNIENNILSNNTAGYKVYSGFVNRTDSNISILAGTFTIAPTVTDYTVYTNGIKHIISSVQTVLVTADQTITYIYIDTNGILQKSTSSWDIEGGDAPTAIVFKDGSEYAVTDERHGYDRNRPWHKWAHNNIGAMYRSGLSGTFTDTTLSVTQGIIADEDLNHDTGGTETVCSLWYRNATTGMRMIRNSSTPYYVSTNLKYDNGSGTLQDVNLNSYSSQWIYATGDTTNPIYVVIGQNNNASLTDARNSSAPVINLSTAEWKLIYKVIYRRTVSGPDFIEALDYRTVQTGVPTASNITVHSSLTGRDVADSHPASAISFTEIDTSISNVQTEITDLNNQVLRQVIFTYTL